MTTAELIAALGNFVFDRQVKIWLPGSLISIVRVIGVSPQDDGVILIEGNIDPGSALQRLVDEEKAKTRDI